MIPAEVEYRIAFYFFRMYLPEEVFLKIVDRLLPTCIWSEDADLDHDELVGWAVDIIDEQLEDKRFK